ncbi:MAG: hydrogenase nickel incorporation protein HypB [Verrucomicrobia bacterium]|nr:hydrogenase nickel incorporation protein HypB [Verrucomicrobiota bacterium]
MCKDCGCGITGDVSIGGQSSRAVSSPLLGGAHSHDHEHGDSHHHHHDDHDHGPEHSHQTVTVQKSILEKNERLAERNRGFFKAKKLLVLNVLSSPGSGKTTLIQQTAAALAKKLRLGVIVGDLATDNDAARLRAAGVPVVQVTTGTVCHLDAEMVARAAGQLDLDALDVLIIENVGNLVCPADYDLGEDLRVVLLSVTEGEDKPLKYPPIFHSANVAVVTKSDLAVAAGFDREKAIDNLHRIGHHARVFELSAKTGEGMAAWVEFLVQQRQAVKG